MSYKLVLEVTRRPVETKAEFLTLYRDFGSEKARVLKSADRIQHMSLGYVTDCTSSGVTRTNSLIFPIAELADRRMLEELRTLVDTRREYLARRFEI